MPLFSSKPKDGPGFVRFRYCGYVSGPGGGPTIGNAAIVLDKALANDAASAKKYLAKNLFNNSIKDKFKKIVGVSTSYQIKSYNGYNESKSKPGTFYHDFSLESGEDSFCNSGGKRRSHRFKNTRRGKTRKSRKTRSRR
jgi:hypothetical protein